MNPYQPPQTGQAPYQNDPSMPPREERERLMRIASDQRMINFVVLAYFGTSVAMANLSDSGVMLFRALAGLVALCVVMAGMVFAIRMASALHGTGIAVLCAILLLVPCVGLLVLLILNSQATRVLKTAGLRVGFLGADPNQFATWR